MAHRLHYRHSMNEWLQQFFRRFRACLCCQSWRTVSGGLCGFCYSRVSKLRCLTNETSPDFRRRIWPLFHWVPGQSDALSKLILYLKGDAESVLWKFWAEQFLITHPAFARLNIRFIIPAPSRSGDRNHALFFAHALSDLLQVPVLECLQFKGEVQEQRQLGKDQRQRRTVELKEGYDKNYMAGLSGLVLVDDVVTTGATMRACQDALGSSKGLIACCLAKRELGVS